MELRASFLKEAGGADVETSSGEDTWLDKARREAKLLGEGLSGFTAAAKEAVEDHPLETASKAVLAFGIGVGMAYLSRGRTLGPIAFKTVGAVSGLAFAKDIAMNGREVGRAMHDTWLSDRNYQENALVMRKHLGKFAFDATIMSVAGGLGARAGHKLFDVRLKDLPKELVPQMNERGISQDYYNKLMMAEHYTNVARNQDGKFSMEKVLKARQSLGTSLKDLVTYRDYWKHEISAYRSGTTSGGTPRPLDSTAAMNVLLHGNRDARRLDSIGNSLRKLAGADLTDQSTLSGMASRFNSARQIIYGPK